MDNLEKIEVMHLGTKNYKPMLTLPLPDSTMNEYLVGDGALVAPYKVCITKTKFSVWSGCATKNGVWTFKHLVVEPTNYTKCLMSKHQPSIFERLFSRKKKGIMYGILIAINAFEYVHIGSSVYYFRTSEEILTCISCKVKKDGIKQNTPYALSVDNLYLLERKQYVKHSAVYEMCESFKDVGALAFANPACLQAYDFCQVIHKANVVS